MLINSKNCKDTQLGSPMIRRTEMLDAATAKWLTVVWKLLLGPSEASHPLPPPWCSRQFDWERLTLNPAPPL